MTKKLKSTQNKDQIDYFAIGKEAVLSDKKYGREKWLYLMFDEEPTTYKEIKSNMRIMWKDAGDKITDPDSFFGKIKLKYNISVGHQINKDKMFYFDRLEGGRGAEAFYEIKMVDINK